MLSAHCARRTHDLLTGVDCRDFPIRDGGAALRSSESVGGSSVPSCFITVTAAVKMEVDSATTAPEIDMAITQEVSPSLFTLTKKSRKCMERLLLHRAEAVDLYAPPPLSACRFTLIRDPHSTVHTSHTRNALVCLSCSMKRMSISGFCLLHAPRTCVLIPARQHSQAGRWMRLIETSSKQPYVASHCVAQYLTCLQFREAYEEVGLPMDHPDIHTLCTLQPFVSWTRLLVTPVVALLTNLDVLNHLIPSEGEVDVIFDHPLEAILDPHLSAEENLVELNSELWPSDQEFHVCDNFPLVAHNGSSMSTLYS